MLISSLFIAPLPRPAAAPVRRHLLADDDAAAPKDPRSAQAAERRRDLLAYLQANGATSTAAIAEWLGVSPKSARYDLKEMQRAKQVRQTGGARAGCEATLWEAYP